MVMKGWGGGHAAVAVAVAVVGCGMDAGTGGGCVFAVLVAGGGMRICCASFLTSRLLNAPSHLASVSSSDAQNL